MIRRLWLLVSLAAAMIFAAPLYVNLPALLDFLSIATLDAAVIALMKSDPAVFLVGRVASGALIFTVMGYGVLAAVEGVLVTSSRARLFRAMAEATSRTPFNATEFRECFAAAPFLADIADAYSSHLINIHNDIRGRKGQESSMERVQGLVSAIGFFGPDALVDRRLFWWLFAPLPTVLIGFGGIIAATVFVRVGVSSAIAPAPAAGSVVALIAALALAGATLIYALSRALRLYRRAQAADFCAALDALLDVAPMEKQFKALLSASHVHARALEGAVQNLGVAMDERLAAIDGGVKGLGRTLAGDLEAALKEPLDTIAKAAAAANSDQSAQVQNLLRVTLKSFVSELEKQVTGHAKTIDVSLAAAANAADKIEKSFAETTRTFTKVSRAQANELSDALQRGIKALAEFEKRSRSDVAADIKTVAERLEKIAETIAPMVEEVKNNQAALLSAVNGDASAAKAITNAAQDLNAAARAGKETLEGFVTLARELREASRAIGNSAQQSGPARPASVGSGKSFGEELKKLRELADERKLPEL
ncbi:MAG: hypothetical protein DCC73_14590 [Proteobacteria bacterium]|nr:MAG: hypothetical protein DCC73_14590 [Pseudomonadota bacterium]